MGFRVSYPIKWIQFLLVGVEELLSYTVLYHMKKNEVSEVIKCFRIHLTLFPMVTVAKSDYGGEFSEKLTLFFSQFNILHYSLEPCIAKVYIKLRKQ